jgi:atypical dual specificity phosphatase
VPRLDYHRLGARLLAGRMPFADEHVATLAAEGVTAVVNLCEEREYWLGERDALGRAYARAGIREHHLPVPDGATVPRDVVERAVEIASEETVYVHCRGGRERSATVAVALLAAGEAIGVDDALERACRARPSFCPLPWQIAALRSWLAPA